jgi:hypothetical protein
MKTSKPYLRLALKLGLLVTPMLIALVLYVSTDPFRVLRRHRPLYQPGYPVSLNRDFVSTELLLDRLREGQRFDVMVFGSSRSLAFRCSDVSRFAGKARCFHYDASNESLFGVLGKARLLRRKDAMPSDALLVVDHALLEQSRNPAPHLFIAHPAVSGESELGFQLTFLKAFLSNLFLVKYAHWRLSGRIAPYMTDALSGLEYEPLEPTNDLVFVAPEAELARGENAYYAKRREVFYDRAAQAGVPHRPALVGDCARELSELARLFAEAGTRVRVIVSPLYEQKPLAVEDLAKLRAAFGADAVFDFSGVNVWTASERNYYESSHYRPHVAQALLGAAYGQSTVR